MKVELGQKVKDQITGFTGVATGRVEYTTGCKQVLVQPPAKPDGDFVDNRWFDEDRLEITDATVIVLKPERAASDGPIGFDTPAPRR